MITMGVMYVRRVCEKPSFGGYQHPISIHELINAARRTLAGVFAQIAHSEPSQPV